MRYISKRGGDFTIPSNNTSHFHIKTILSCCILLLCTTLLTACNKNYSSYEKELKATADNANLSGQTITVMASSEWIKNSMLQLGSDFESVTGVEVRYELYPDEGYLEQLFSRLNSENAPDIFLTQSGFAIETTYHLQDYALPLTNEPWAPYYDEFTSKETSIEGINYGLTYYDTTTDYYLIYNKKLMNQVGISMAPTTYDEFLELCARFKEHQITPLYEPMADGWHQTMLFAENGQVFEYLEPGLFEQLNQNKATFADNLHMQLALEQIQQIALCGYMGDTFATDSFETAVGYLASGEYAMCLLKPGAINSILDSDLNNGFKREDFGIMLLPICDNQILNIHPTGPTHFINKASKHLLAAKLYLNYLATPENIQYTIDHTKEFENLPFELELNESYDIATSHFLESFDDAHSGTVLQDEVTYFNEQWGEISHDILRMCQGELTPQEVLAAIDERRNAFAIAAGDSAWK